MNRGEAIEEARDAVLDTLNDYPADLWGDALGAAVASLLQSKQDAADIDELKAAIEIAGKVLQNLVVVPMDGGKYKVIAGHRRRLASIALVEEGKPQFEFVPCDIEPNEEAAEDQEVRDGLMLIVTNSQREKRACAAA